MAEVIFNALVEDNGTSYCAESAGIAALEGGPMAQKAGEVLAEFGFTRNVHHRARQVSRQMVEEADLTLAMTYRHLSYLREMHNDPAKVWLLTEYATGGPCREEITDPYGGPTAAYRASVRQLLTYLEPVVERISRHNRTF